MKYTTFEIVILGMLGAIACVCQVALSFLPNIEVVSILFIVYTKVFGKKALFPIYVFVLLEGIFWGVWLDIPLSLLPKQELPVRMRYLRQGTISSPFPHGEAVLLLPPKK